MQKVREVETIAAAAESDLRTMKKMSPNEKPVGAEAGWQLLGNSIHFKNEVLTLHITCWVFAPSLPIAMSSIMPLPAGDERGSDHVHIVIGVVISEPNRVGKAHYVGEWSKRVVLPIAD